MKNVSRQYKSSMKQTMRNRSRCVVTFGATDQTAITDGSWTGDASPISSFDLLDFEHNYGNTIATLELNRWVLDKKCDIKRDNDGYIASEYMVYGTDEEDGTIYPQSIVKRFSSTHNVNGITLTFDTRTNAHPYKVSLTYYNGMYETGLETDDVRPIVDENGVELSAMVSTGGTGVVATSTVYPTSNTCEINLNGENVDLIEIKFYSVLPYTRPRLEHITWGVASIFSDTQLISVHQSHDVDPMSRRLPVEKLSFKISDYDHFYDPDNPQGAYAYINKGAPITVSFGYDVDGVTEWVKSDRYALEDVPTFKDNQVTFSSVGMIGTLTRSYYKDVYNAGGKTLYSLANAVLLDAGLSQTAEGTNPWVIDNALNSMYTTAVLPIDTHANLLQMIAHASGCRFYTDDDNIIHLKPFGITPVGIFSGTYTDNGHTDYSEWHTVDYGTTNTTDTATLELNKWVLDGSNTIDRISNGYVSSDMSDQTGDCELKWGKVYDVPHDLPLFTVTFDTVGNTHPYKMEVKYYENSTLLGTETVYPTTTSVTVNAENINDCTSIEVTAFSALPYTRARVSAMSFRETDFSLQLDSVKENTLVTNKLEKLRNVIVNEYKYVKEEDNTSTPQTPVYRVDKLYEGDTNLTSLHIEYSTATDISVTVTGGTVTSQNIYAQACDLVMSAGNKHILITGTPIASFENQHTYAVNVVGDDDVEENMLITNKTMADSLGNHVKEYLTLRNTYDCAYRGNPELETGDIISMETLYSNVVYGIVLTDEISYNGALSGKVKVKGLC